MVNHSYTACSSTDHAGMHLCTKAIAGFTVQYPPSPGTANRSEKTVAPELSVTVGATTTWLTTGSGKTACCEGCSVSGIEVTVA